MSLANKKNYSKRDVRYYMSVLFDVFLMVCLFCIVTCYAPFVSDAQFYNGGAQSYWLTTVLQTLLVRPSAFMAAAYLIMFKSNHLRLLKIVKRNWPLFLLVVAGLISISYSDETKVSFNKFVYFIEGITVLLAIIVKDNEYIKTLNRLYYLFSIIVILSYLEMLLNPSAAKHGYVSVVRLADDLISNWKGIFYHKNAAGGILGFFTLILFGKLCSDPKVNLPVNLTLLFLTLIFLWCSFAKGSMSALAFSFIVTVVFFALVIFSKNLIYRYAIAMTFVSMLLAFNYIATYYLAPEHNITFTHRTDIWILNYNYWMDSWRTVFFGHGFGAVYTGNDSGIAKYREGWEALIGSAHSGYVSILGELGLLGITLWGICMIQTIYNSFKFLKMGAPLEVWAMSACLYFGFIRALTEPDLMAFNRPNWPIVFMMIILINTYANVKTEILNKSYQEKNRSNPKRA